MGLAVIFVIATHINAMYGWHWPTAQRIFTHLIDQVELPAIFVGILISGNAEAPNATAVYITLFLTYVIISGSLVALGSLVYRKIHQHRATKANKN
jgi:hypothetical protein